MSKETQSPSLSFKYLYILTGFFVSILVISNIASSAKIVDLGFSIFNIPLAFDGGTILFPLVYILGDVITEVYGFTTAKRVIWTGFAVMALAALAFFVLGRLPGDSGWQNSFSSGNRASAEEAYSFILGGMSSGGIVLASLAAYLVGELSNALALSKIKIKTKGRAILGQLWVRTIGSTLIGEALDTFIFILIATVVGVFPWGIFWSLVITNYIIKCGIEILATPATCRLIAFQKKKEGVDIYDD